MDPNHALSLTSSHFAIWMLNIFNMTQPAVLLKCSVYDQGSFWVWAEPSSLIDWVYKQEWSLHMQAVSVTISPWWRHQMETFSALMALCAGNSPVTGEFPAQRPVTRSFDVFSIWDWMNGWVNNREAGDLRPHRAHYDVTVMKQEWSLHMQAVPETISPRYHDNKYSIGIGNKESYSYLHHCSKIYLSMVAHSFTRVKQCTFHWLISSELIPKQRVFNSLTNNHLIMTTCISYGNIFAISIPKCIDRSTLNLSNLCYSVWWKL